VTDKATSTVSIVDPETGEEKTAPLDEVMARHGRAAQLAEWPSDEVEYIAAPEVEAIARDILAMDRQVFAARNVRVFYRFKRSYSGGKIGECRLVGAFWREFVPADFIITVGWKQWRYLSDKQKQRVVYHELCHIGLNESGGLVVEKHEFEGFVSEWVRFRDVVEESGVGRVFRAEQQSLFGGGGQ